QQPVMLKNGPLQTTRRIIPSVSDANAYHRIKWNNASHQTACFPYVHLLLAAGHPFFHVIAQKFPAAHSVNWKLWFLEMKLALLACSVNAFLSYTIIQYFCFLFIPENQGNVY